MLESILLSFALILFAAIVAGKVAQRVRLPPIVGYLAAGLIVGPVTGIIRPDEFLVDFITLSVIFLLLMAGLETKFTNVKKNVYAAIFLAFTGGLLSFILGFMVGMAFTGSVIVSLAIGTALVSTSNITLFIFLKDTGEFNSKIGQLIVAVTIIDDIVGMLFLAMFSMYLSQALTFSSIFFLALVCVGFYFLMTTAGLRFVTKSLNPVSKFLDNNALFAIPVAFTFLLAFVSDRLGLTLAIGAFLAGTAIANSQYAESVITPKVNTFVDTFIMPMFYGAIGSILVLTDLSPVLIAAIVIAAVLGKFIGCGLMSRIYGVKWSHQKLLGLVMAPRGNENVAIVQIMLLLGAITLQIYTSLMFAMVLTIILTPMMLKAFYRKY